ncbi:MAG: hypothetical protein SH809_18765 [Rhodothermales bacterium]|nr:hypothetical protein [Rhodothermales bacterium]
MIPPDRYRFWAVALPGAAFAGVLAVGSDADTIRWFMEYAVLLAVGVLAMSLPHLALPDPNQFLFQLANVAPVALAAGQWRRWQPVALGLLVPGAVLAFWPPLDGVRLVRGVAYALVVGGVAFEALGYYHRIGPLSQEWSEGKRGDVYRWLKENTPYSVALPDGLVPAFLGTGRLFILGATVHLAGRLLEGVHLALAVVPGLVLFVVGILRWRASRAGFDGPYYHSNAFFREIFAAGRLHAAPAPALPYDSLYWIPTRLRPAAWLVLLQLDRRIPLGRLLAFGHGLFWVMVWRGAPEAAVTALLAVLVVAPRAVSTIAARPPILPAFVAMHYLSRSDWHFVRLWINLRWTFPFIASVALVEWASPAWTFAGVVLWAGVDLLAALIAASAGPRPRASYAG